MGDITTDPVVNAQDQSHLVYAVCITFSILSLTFVVLRIYTRFRILRRPAADDAAIVVAEVLAIAAAIGASMEARYGLGRHIWTLTKDEILMQLTWLYVVIIIYNVTMNVIKLAFLLQYRRFLNGKWALRLCNWTAAVVIPMWTIVHVVTVATACSPIGVIVPSMFNHCLPQAPIWYFTGAANIATDFFIFFLPLPSIFGLRMVSKKQKAVLLLIFSLGFFVCAISIIRILALRARLSSTDTSWGGVSPACWSIVEIHCAIVCSCLATLRPLFRRVLPWLGGGADNAVPPSQPFNDIETVSKRKQGSGSSPRQSDRRISSGSAEPLKDLSSMASTELR